MEGNYNLVARGGDRRRWWRSPWRGWGWDREPSKMDMDWYKSCLGLPNFVGLLEVRKYTFDTDYYRLFYF